MRRLSFWLLPVFFQVVKIKLQNSCVDFKVWSALQTLPKRSSLFLRHFLQATTLILALETFCKSPFWLFTCVRTKSNFTSLPTCDSFYWELFSNGHISEIRSGKKCTLDCTLRSLTVWTHINVIFYEKEVCLHRVLFTGELFKQASST